MCKITLLSAKRSLEDFIGEARFCASEGKGFASMLTILPVLLAVGEADTSEEGMKKQIRGFASGYPAYRKWLLHEGSDLSTDQVVDYIYDLRNALAHNASTPEKTYLVKSVRGAESLLKPKGENMYVGVTEFIEAVDSYVKTTLNKKPTATFDPIFRKKRGPAEAGTFRSIPLSGFGLPDEED
jgi:hypothetical protein